MRLLWPLLALVAILLFNLFFTPDFFSIEIRDGHLYGSLIDILKNGSAVILLAMGMSLVIATAGIDLSVGAVMAIAGVAAGVVILGPKGLTGQPLSFLSNLNVHGNLAVVLALAIGVSLLAGLWNGLLVCILDVQPIVATLILMISGRGVALYLAGGNIVTFRHSNFEWLGGGFLLGLPVPAWIALFMAAVTGLLTRATALGLLLESIGNNAVASRYAGVNARMVTLLAYTWCGLCAGIAGMIAVADVHSAQPNDIGRNFELDAILAVAIGGTSLAGGRFSLLGSLIGALVIQSLTTTIYSHDVQPAWTLVVKSIVVIIVCLLQSEPFRRLILFPFRRRTP